MSIVGDIYEGGSAKPISFHNIGDTVEGEIVAIRTKQLPKFGTDVPEVWPSGEPKMTPIVTVQTEVYEDDEDDGRRDVYLRNNAFTAFGQALREAYKTRPTDEQVIGSVLKIRFHKTEKSGKGQPRKLFLARITPKAQTAGAAWEDAPEPVNGAGHSGSDDAAEDKIPF